MSMRVREVETAFGLRRRLQHVADAYAATYWAEGKVDKKYAEYMHWAFGFEMKAGDIVCAAILRKGPEPKPRKKGKR